MQTYSKLLEPIRIGNHAVKNRMVFPNASPHCLQGPETYPAKGMRAFHAGLARNGAGIVTIAEWNNPDQRKGPISLDHTHFQSWDLNDPSVHNYLSMMAEEVHFYGSKLLICMQPTTFPAGYSLYGRPPMGPPRPGVTYEMAPKEIIEQAIAAFVEKCRMYKGLGYDGLSMRCDMEILKKPGVVRDDEYSPATMESRSLFIRQIYAAVKEALGDDFITEATIAWEQPWGYGDMEPGSGVSEEEVLEFCKLIDKDVDIFQVREHDGIRSHPIGFNFKPGEHPAADACKRMKAAGITALLEPIGGFQEPEEMEQLLKDGVCDMFGMARAFIADPEYGDKLYEGKGADVMPCLKCNKCHGEVLNHPKAWISACSVNPIFGLEHDMDWLTAYHSEGKKVAVIGGGPAGMRAAIEAARLGHKVTLFEKTDRLGGQLLHADYFDFKWPVKNFKDWLIRQLGEYQVEVVMNCCPTKDQITAGGYDAVLAATGAVAQLPKSVKGVVDEAGKALYQTCDDIWGKEAELGHHVVIVGGSETCMETAIYLLRAGHKVTVLTRQNEVAHDASKLHYITWAFVVHNPDGTHRHGAEWERYEQFTGITNASTTAVDGNTVTYVDAEGNEQTITADDVVLYGGRYKCMDEALYYNGCANRFDLIGDCNNAGNLQACNRQAYAAAHRV